MAYVTFSFELDTEFMRHIDAVSSYNKNFYELDLNHYGDYILPAQCNILYEEFDEFSGIYTYTLGFFRSGSPLSCEFISCFTWIEMECKTLGVKL